MCYSILQKTLSPMFNNYMTFTLISMNNLGNTTGRKNIRAWPLNALYQDSQTF